MITQNTSPKKIELTTDEIDQIIQALVCQPHNIFEHLNQDKLVKKFKDLLEEK